MTLRSVKRLIERALWDQGIRKPLLTGHRRHEWKGAHGFRKFYKTRTEQVMRPINVEITMGHNIGLSGSYYKPTEKEILEDYLKAIELLTIDDSNRLREKIVSLEGKQDNIDIMKLEYNREVKVMRQEITNKVRAEMLQLFKTLKPDIILEAIE